VHAVELAKSRSTELVPDDPPPPVADGTRIRGGASLLEREACCPARAFLQYRLGARELSTPRPGIDPATRGSMVHALMDGFFARVRSREQLCALSAIEQASLLDTLIDTVIARHLPQREGLVAQLARNEAARLHALAARFLDTERRRPDFEVLWTESMPAADQPRRMPAAVQALGVELRPDRVDALPDGRTLIIDYKTGSRVPGASELCGPRPRAPQLPLYATLTDASGIAFVHLGAGPVTWLGVGHESWDIHGIRDPDDFTGGAAPNWGALRASWWSALDRLANEILRGCFDVDRWRLDDASGQWALATRVCELGAEPDEGSDG
jgi:exodeoxyribonuclease-5